TKSPTKNIPRAVLFSIAVSTVIYVLVAISAVSILNWQTLAASSAPLADVAKAGLGAYTFLIIAIVALFSTTNTVLMDIVTTSRMLYGMARRKVLPERLGRVHGSLRTPHYAIFVVSLLTIILIFIRDLERVASLANFFTFVTFGIVNFAVIRLRWTYTKRRPFRIPGSVYGVPVIPLLGGILSFGMLYYVFAGII
ncbi:MAG: amino acid permease, partial [Patescibacteria group bacterium]